MINPGFFFIMAGIFSYFIDRNKKLFILATVTSLTAMYYIIFGITFGRIPFYESLLVFEFMDLELVLFRVNSISRTVSIIFVLFGYSGFIYSYRLASKKFFMISLLLVGFSVSLLYVGDLFSFFVLWELMNIATFFLVYDMSDEKRRQIAQYFFLMLIFGGMCLLWGIILHYTSTGNLALDTAQAGRIFFVISVAIKMAFAGVHTWLPRTYTNVPFLYSVLLSAYTTKVGVYGLYHLLDGEFIMYAGAFNALFGVIMALQQSTIRRILCYHIVSQVGYMIAGMGLITHAGNIGGFFHVINHILYKGLLFMMAGSVIYSVGTEKLKDLGGLWKKMPITFVAGLIASLSISGAPFFNGYLSKTLIKTETPSQLVYYGLYIAGIGTTLSFAKIMYYTFIRDTEQEIEINRSPTASMKTAMIFLSAVMMIMAWTPGISENAFNIETGIEYFSLYHLWGGAQPVLLGIISFPFLKRWLKPHEVESFGEDPYSRLGRAFTSTLCLVLSRLHTGDEVRYISWVLLALIFLLFNIYLINNVFFVSTSYISIIM